MEASDADIVDCGVLQDKGWEEKLQGYRKDFYSQD